MVSERQPSTESNPRVGEPSRIANILLLEPDRESRERLRLWLQLDGHRVAEAGEEAEALTIIAQEPPDLVLLDLSRPAISWMEFFVRLNRLRPHPHVQVIAIAPCGAGAAGCQGIRFFADDVLQQPVRQEQLRRAVGEAMKEIAAPSSDAQPRA